MTLLPRIRALAVVPLLALLGVVAPAAARALTLDEVLKSLDERQKTIGRVEADFVQTKTSTLFRAEMTSKGRMRADTAGNLVWEYTEPDPASFRIEGDTITLRLPGAKEDQKLKLAEMPSMSRLFQSTRLLGAGQTSADLQRDYEVAMVPASNPGRAGLRLTPRGAEVAGLFQYLVLTLDTTSWNPVACEIHEAEGEWTKIEFKNVKATPR